MSSSRAKGSIETTMCLASYGFSFADVQLDQISTVCQTGLIRVTKFRHRVAQSDVIGQRTGNVRE